MDFCANCNTEISLTEDPHIKCDQCGNVFCDDIFACTLVGSCVAQYHINSECDNSYFSAFSPKYTESLTIEKETTKR